MGTLHNNRKVTANDENMPGGDRREYSSRSSHLEQAFQKMNQSTFDALTFQEFSKEFPVDLVRSNEAFLRELHSQFVNISVSAIQARFENVSHAELNEWIFFL